MHSRRVTGGYNFRKHNHQDQEHSAFSNCSCNSPLLYASAKTTKSFQLEHHFIMFTHQCKSPSFDIITICKAQNFNKRGPPKQQVKDKRNNMQRFYSTIWMLETLCLHTCIIKKFYKKIMEDISTHRKWRSSHHNTQLIFHFLRQINCLRYYK